MKENLQKRLEELKKEFESGQQMLAELDAKKENLRNTLLRISGAIQVIQEQVGSGGSDDDSLMDESSIVPENEEDTSEAEVVGV